MTTNTRSTDFAVDDVRIDGPHGTIPLRTYLPGGATQGLVWVHGGAFAFGTLDDPESDWVARQIAASGIAVVTVDYRLAPVPDWMAAVIGVPARPGVRYPVASEEVSAAFQWALSLLPDVPPSRWSLGGASAGANLAAGAALRMRDTARALPSTLVLTYGLFHAPLPELRPEVAEKFAALPPELAILKPEVLQAISLNYVGDSVHLGECYAFAGGHDLEGLPPALLVNSDADTIRASGEAFGAELAAAGVDLALVNEVGSVHGHLSTPDEVVAARTIERIERWLTDRESLDS